MFELPSHRIKVRQQPGHVCAGLNVWVISRQHQQPCFRIVHMTDQEFAFGAQQSDGECGRAAARVCFIAEQLVRNLQIGDGSIVGGRGTRAPSGGKIDENDFLPFGLARYSGQAAVQLVGNNVKVFTRSFGSRPSCQGHADPKMQSRLISGRQQRIGGLLNPIMCELVRTIEAYDQLETNSFRQIRANLSLRCPLNERERCNLGAVAETGESQ